MRVRERFAKCTLAEEGRLENNRVYNNLLSVVAEGCDQQRRHSDARAKRHRERDRGSGIAEEEVAMTQRRRRSAAVAAVCRSKGGRLL
ncbi:hypothetical protein B296_00055791 [Ensete ventricosum]|uniref:Uncharacterized protein n=1 Tax=Ensete ventricosum TaxID=4639 RepID=A0A426X2W8_ENSVE|nr:hypothetical protein B296_00055791 [Ensete ventricosum]